MLYFFLESGTRCCYLRLFAALCLFYWMTVSYKSNVNVAPPKRVCVLVNPRSGLYWSFGSLRRALDRVWDRSDTDLTYRFCQGVDDGVAKTRRAVSEGADTVLVAGGDGTVNTIGRALVGSDVALGILPVGSGNGFARHFEIPLAPEKAAACLASASVRRIDVGFVNDRPFLVTCSMAWDAAIARSFEKSPVRGIVPYVFAGVYEFFEYQTQEMKVQIDADEELSLPDPLVFTIANLTQYGGGARIAPQARPDDGYLELVVALRQDVPKLITNIHRLFDGSVARIPEVISRRFQSLVIRRERPAPMQIDGELVEAPAELKVSVRPAALKVLVPS